MQTNEVRRSWFLLPCFLEVARRTGAEELDLIELGSSAGFNLLWDRYRYLYEAGTWGPVDALLELDGEERRPVPAELLALAASCSPPRGSRPQPRRRHDRRGRAAAAFVRLARAAGRMERLDRAIEAVRAEPPELRQGDIAEALPGLLAERAPDALDRRLRDRGARLPRRGALGSHAGGSGGRRPRRAVGARLDRPSAPTCTRTGACGFRPGPAASRSCWRTPTSTAPG